MLEIYLLFFGGFIYFFCFLFFFWLTGDINKMIDANIKTRVAGEKGTTSGKKKNKNLKGMIEVKQLKHWVRLGKGFGRIFFS